jgi:hypothetical protein
MSDETKGLTPHPSPTETDPPAADPTEVKAPAPAPPIGLDAEVEVDGTRVKVRDLIQDRERAEALEAYRKHASNLMSGDGEFGDDKEQSLRFVMTAEGWDPESIDEHIQTLRSQPVEPEPTNTPKDPPARERDRESGGAAYELEQRIQQLEAQLKEASQQSYEAQERVGEQKVAQMRRDMEEAVERTLDSHPDVTVLLGRMKELNGAEGHETRLKAFRDEIHRQAMDLMKARKASGQRFDDSWFAEETEKAAKMVAMRYRTVIGDPNKLMRAPETVSGEDTLVRREAPKPPQWQPGDDGPKVLDKAREYTKQTLQWLATQSETADQTKV